MSRQQIKESTFNKLFSSLPLKARNLGRYLDPDEGDNDVEREVTTWEFAIKKDGKVKTCPLLTRDSRIGRNSRGEFLWDEYFYLHANNLAYLISTRILTIKKEK